MYLLPTQLKLLNPLTFTSFFQPALWQNCRSLLNLNMWSTDWANSLSRISWNLISEPSWKLTAHTLWTTWENMRIYPNSWLLNHIFVMKGNNIISSHIDIVVIGPAKSATNEAISGECRLIKPWDLYGFNGHVNTLALERQGFHSDLRCQHADWDQLPAVAEGRQFASKLGRFCSAYSEMQAVSFQIRFKNRFVIFNQSRDSKWSHDLSYSTVFLYEDDPFIGHLVSFGVRFIWKRHQQTSLKLLCHVCPGRTSLQSSVPNVS